MCCAHSSQSAKACGLRLKQRFLVLTDTLPHNADSNNGRKPHQDVRPAASPHESEDKMITPVAAPPRASHRESRFPELSRRLEKDLVQVFKLLADETRLKILLYLTREGELNVTALCDRLHQSQPAVSHHLALLRDARLIEPRRDGKHNFYSVQKSHFHHLIHQLFESMSDNGDHPVRIDDLVITQES